MSSDDKDRLIIERVKAGETAAFKELIERHKDMAFSLACSILKDKSLAEDVLQETFIKVFNKLHSFKYQSLFTTWLYRIVVNRCYNELRKRRKFRNEIVEVASEVEDAATLTDTNNLKHVINAALEKMKPDEALVLRLFYLSELKIEEVEDVTNFSKSKVKVTLHRGRKNLATILKQKLGKEIDDL